MTRRAAQSGHFSGKQRVQPLFDRPGGNSLRVDAGADYRINLTHDLEQRLARWQVGTKAERLEGIRVARHADSSHQSFSVGGSLGEGESARKLRPIRLRSRLRPTSA